MERIPIASETAAHATRPSALKTEITPTRLAAASGVTPVSYVLYAGSAPGLADIAALELASPATAVSGPVPAGVYFMRVAARGSCGVGAVSIEQLLVVGGTTP